MKRWICLLSLLLMGFRWPQIAQLEVANAVDPLIYNLIKPYCGKMGVQLIWKDVPSQIHKVGHGCSSGINHEYFARCYKSEWKGPNFESSHLFFTPIKDVDLHSFTCVSYENWPYQDLKMQNAPLGVEYENQ